MSTENATMTTEATTTTTPTQATAQATTPTPSGKTAAPQAATATEAPQYTPNYKFKVYDEEKEIDPLFRDLIKDQDTEKKIREFHEKAYGLDVQKPKYEKLKTDHAQISEKYQNIDNSLKQLSTYIRAGDLGSFFDSVNIPKEMVFNFVKQELEKMSAPPEQRQHLEEFDRIRRENLALKQQSESWASKYETESIQARSIELDTAISKPDVAQVASVLDAKLGNGAFRNAVIERGLIAFHTTGKEIPVSQAVQEAVARYSQLVTGQAQQGQATGIEMSEAPQAPKATLPNVGGRSTSPIKRGPRSIEDLKKIAQAGR